MEIYKNVHIIVNEAEEFQEENYTVKASVNSLVYRASFAGNFAYGNSTQEVVNIAKREIDRALSGRENALRGA